MAGGACRVPLLSSSPMSLAIIAESLPLIWKRKRSKLDETAMSTVSIEGVTVSATPELE